MAVLGFAIWMRMDPKVNHYVRASYEVDDINMYYIICYLLMGTGGIMTFVGFLGCCGAFQESRCMLGTVSIKCIDLCEIFIHCESIDIFSCLSLKHPILNLPHSSFLMVRKIVKFLNKIKIKPYSR